jgi:hypothetical protein
MLPLSLLPKRPFVVQSLGNRTLATVENHDGKSLGEDLSCVNIRAEGGHTQLCQEILIIHSPGQS